ncbi:MAG: LD-carboxypeptidase [Pseudomonadota bacterium]|nr:LD-carboxypeptidase [Pseudomonadota bacterium]
MSSFAKWNCLVKGDIVDVIAPGSGASEKSLNQIILFLGELGLKPRIPKDLLGPELLSSNTDDARARHLITALHDVHSKAVWCVKNGYGSGRLTSILAKINKPLRPKLFIGGPDATALHLHLNNSWKWSTIYGPTLDQVVSKKMSKKSLEELVYVIRGKVPEISFDGLKPLNESAKIPGMLMAPIIGGHLSKISLTIGTAWSSNPKATILFLDESGSRAHEIDGFLEHLIQSNYLSNVKAVIFGSLLGCTEPDGSSLWPPILDRFASAVDIPVLSGVQNVNSNLIRIIPFGTEAELTTGAKGRLSVAIGGNGEGTSSSIHVA